MRYAAVVLSALSLLAAPSSRLAAQGFEGVMVFDVFLFSPKPMKVTQMTKGSKLRIEGMGGPGQVMILNGGRVIQFSDRKKTYEVIPNDAISNPSELHVGSVVRTGKTDKVAGIPCEVWHFKKLQKGEKAEESDVCISKSMGFAIWRMFGKAAAGFFNGDQAFVDMLTKTGGGMMRSSTDGQDQVVTVKVEAKPIPDAMFEPPPGYTLEPK